MGRRPARSVAAGRPRPANGPGRIRSTLLRQVTVLGLVCCAVALVLAFPFRSYLAETAELHQQVAQERVLQDQLAALTEQKTALQNEDYIKTQARQRLQYVQPGETAYVIDAPALSIPAGAEAVPTQPGPPWYARLWDTLADPVAGVKGR